MFLGAVAGGGGEFKTRCRPEHLEDLRIKSGNSANTRERIEAATLLSVAHPPHKRHNRSGQPPFEFPRPGEDHV